MKFHETHYEEYLNANKQNNLHPKMKTLLAHFPAKLKDLKNVIFYGPQGIGKYTQMLASIKGYSPSELKYEKKLSVLFNKQNYYFKISDIHYEVDMSLLGCNSKLLWHDIYQQIVDIISTKPDKMGILVCKNFHEIHSELLENFYSYMQKNNFDNVLFQQNNIDIKFIFITEEISFIPNNILNCCEIIALERPKKSLYKKCIKNGGAPLLDSGALDLEQISNIKNLHSSIQEGLMPYQNICDKILGCILNVDDMKYVGLRDLLYEIFIYNLDVSDCIWYILHRLFSQNKIEGKQIPELLIRLYCFFQYFNNNYRTIYHLESFIVYLITLVHKY
jgi:hypothetical protein